MASLRSDVVSFGALFAPGELYYVPSFQRQYSWLEVDIAPVLSDLWLEVDRYLADEQNLDLQFFGSIVLLDQTEQGPQSGDMRGDVRRALGIVDGQQRMLTFTMLWAMLRDRIGSQEPWLATMVMDSDEAPTATARITAQIQDQLFFDSYVQRPGATLQVHQFDGDRKLAQARALLLEDLETRSSDQLIALARFMRDHCRVVVIRTDSIDLALAIFSTINTTGRPLTPDEVLKTEIIGRLPSAAVEQATLVWEEKRTALGSQFDMLPSHIQAIRGGRTSSIIGDLRRTIDADGGAAAFFDSTFIPMTDALNVIASAKHQDSPHSARINATLRYLGLLNSTDWVPPLLAFLVKHDDDREGLATFVSRFDKLAFGLMIYGTTRDNRIKRYARLIREIDKQNGRLDAMPSLDLTNEEQKTIQRRITRDLHRQNTLICKIILLRLSGYLDRGPMPLKLNEVTVEHVLPIKPPRGSAWLKQFPESSQRDMLTRCLGNLVLLTEKQNKAAQNSDYPVKRAIIFPGNGPHQFLVTNQIWRYQNWTPEVIEERQAILVPQLCSMLAIEPPAQLF
jgi:Protein of unknown function DUF262/Protein of unknown function (DUF1524)